MPHYFPNTIRAMLKGRSVRVAYLAKFDFDTTSGFEPAHLWNGSMDIVSGGATWRGLRKLGNIEGLEEVQSGAASTIRASISGVDSFFHLLQAAVSEDKAHYVGRMLRVFLQFFDADWQVLDDPYALAAGIMDAMEISRQQREDGATVRTIAVTAPNIFYARRQAPFGYFTDRDQQARHPGDHGLEFIAELQSTSIPVPWTAAATDSAPAPSIGRQFVGPGVPIR